MFDEQQLQRWNINEKQLPPGSVVINRQETLWSRYRSWILITLAVVLLQAALIVSLVLLRIREHRAEQQLAAEKSTLRSTQELNGTILDSLSSHLAVLDPLGVIIATNRRWREYWAQNGDPNELPTTYLEVCQRWIPSSHAAQQAFAGITAVLEGARDTFEMEYECTTADRHGWFDMYVTPLLRSNGAVIRHLDITSRKKAELQLRESEARFRLIADSAPVMIWMSGTDKLCTYFNKVWLEFTGRNLTDEPGNGWTEGIHPSDVERCLRVYDESFAARRAFTIEHRLRRADGRYRWVLDNGVPRNLADGTFAGYIGGCVDVTEQEESEEARSHLSGLLIGAQEQERTRIARELHDHINQRLALLAIELQQFEQSAANLNLQQKEGLERLWGETNDISRDVQELSHQLHSSQLQHLGLMAALAR